MLAPLRILHLEDCTRDAALVRSGLEAGGLSCQIVLVHGKDDFEAALTRDSFDLIISDYTVPGYGGLIALKRAQTTHPDVPVILISGTVGDEEAVKSLHVGATDYLLKGRLERLVPAVRRALHEAERRRTRQGVEAALRERTRDLERQILERQQVEVELRQERDRAQTYLERAEVILLKLDIQARVTLVNRYACAVLGWSEAELVGRDFIETCIPARMRATIHARFGEVIEGDSAAVEALVVTKSGEERLIEWRNSLLRDDAGTVVGTFSSGTDITERTRAAHTLQATEERTRFALEAAGVGIWDMDVPTGRVQWSAILESQYGLPPGCFGGTFAAYIDLVHPDDRAALLETIAKANVSGADFTTQHRTRAADGAIRWLSGAGRFHLDEHGNPARGVGISLDITERRMLEEQYQQAQKMEAIGRLAGGVAHDFNNLLTVILGYCELLLADLVPGDAHQGDMIEIQLAGTRAAGLTRQLLAFSRKQIIEPIVLDVNAVVSGMRVMLQRLIGEDVKVVLDLQAGLSSIRADRGQIEQIVMNLAVNARDAMPRGGTLRIATANVELGEQDPTMRPPVRPGSYVEMSVTDNGTGMSHDVQARVFEPFFTTKDAGSGTGLGLATVHGIVTQNGGSVRIDSIVGAGTSLRVYFLRSEGVVLEVHPSAEVGTRSVQGRTVLVVEDEVGLRELTRKLLERQGYAVLLAANADEALPLCDTTDSIDVVLTDVVMPGASGPELMRQILERRPGLPVIYMSGYNAETIVHHGVLNPGVAFLQKPFTSERLGQKIRDVLQIPEYRGG